MSAESFKRKLTAILSADVKGYSRLMGENEADTVRTLTSYRKIMGELIQQHRGRVIDSPGDNILAEFGSVVDAVQCSVAAQNEFKARNAELPENRRMVFRIGVNLGDVIEEEGRIYGDGVNIAARLEALAEPGGICISKTAFDHIESKLPLGYQFLGEQTVKNIAKPVGAYKVLMEPRVLPVEEKKKAKEITFWQRKPFLAGAVAVLVVIIGVAVWNFYWRAPKIEPVSKEKMAFPLPDKPSIAVLPFANMSGDPKEDYFSDGLTEQIITSLSMVPRLFVIARNSTFVYKGKAVKVQTVAEEQGVQYVLEGGVQKSQDRVRITVQLIDAIKGHHLWSERYDRELKDLFALQDDIVKQIMTAIQVKLTEGEYASVKAGGTSNLKAFECFLRAAEHADRWSREGNAAARQWAERAIELDPNYANAWTRLGSTHVNDFVYSYSNSPAQSLKRAEECAQKALSINESNAPALSLMGGIRRMQGKWDEAVQYGEKALAINPNNPGIMFSLALTLEFLGRFDEAIALGQKILRICPYYPATYLSYLASVYPAAGRYQEAIEACKLMLDPSRKGEINLLYAHLFLAEAYVGLGQLDKARAEAEEVMKIDPKYSLGGHKRLTMYKDPAIGERRLAALRKAGLPDKPPLPLPDKPSIAVLPFVNMSEDKSQEYFSDGLTEEIITALSKTPKLFVIARNSTFVYKGKPVNVQQVGRELGVKYVLEGSVRKSGDQLRITAQLIDATTGNHLWAERYDRSLGQIFSLQDEITLAIVKAMRVTLTEGEQANLTGKGTTNLDAYLKALEASEQFFRMNREGSMKAKQFAGEAIALDPKYAFPHAIMANAHMLDLWFGFGKSPQESMKLASEAAHKALSLDNSDPFIYSALSNLNIMQRQYDQAIASAERAVELCPSGARAHFTLGTAYLFACRPAEAVRSLELAIRLNPFPPGRNFSMLGSAYRLLERDEEAIVVYKKGLQTEPGDLFTHLGLTVAYFKSGREEEASKQAAEVMKLHPKFSLDDFGKIFHLKDQSIADDYLASLRKAGLK